MADIRFDVNDREVRDTFLRRQVMEAVALLGPDDLPRWGGMSAQHMVEHLQWAFACSTGALVVPCQTPPQLIDRAKRFLYDGTPTKREFKNPLLGDVPPPLRFPEIDSARLALGQELAKFLTQIIEEPEAKHTHPIFGILGAEEWHRVHFKHCYHHLLQFGAISEEGPLHSSR